MKNRALKLVLAGLLLFVGAYHLYGQQQKVRPAEYIREVEFHVPGKLKFSLSGVQKKYLYKRPDKATLESLKADVRQQFQNNGYYLAKIDSIITVDPAQPDGATVLRAFITPGMPFLFSSISLQLPDSTSEDTRVRLNDIVHSYSHRIYSADLQEQLFAAILNLYENEGYPLSRIETTGFSLDSLAGKELGVNLQLAIQPGPEVRLQGLKIDPASHLNINYLARALNFKPGELYQENRILRYQKRLAREDFIENASSPQIILDENNHYYLRLNYKEAPATVFDGIVGYVPAPAGAVGQSGYFTGLINVGLRNVLGTGRRINVHWQKPDRYSDEFRIQYREPFVFGLPFHTGVEMYRFVRDTTYIEWKYALNFDIPLNDNISGIFRFYSREVFPDSLASESLRLPQTRSVHTELGLNWDNRDDVYNPSRGIYFSALFDYGTQRNIGPYFLVQEDSLAGKTSVQKVTGRLDFFFSTFKKQVVSLNLNTVLLNYRNGIIRLPDMYWFGGATTIRGYREQQFYADRVGWVNAEYRFLLGPKSRFFVFSDGGYYSRKLPEQKEEFLLGYGLGIRFPGPLGALQVDYGMAKGDPFREGKIHFRLINEF